MSNNRKKEKNVLCKREQNMRVMFIMMIVLGILGFWFFQSPIYLLMLLVFFVLFMIMNMIYFIIDMKRMKAEEPFTLFITMLAVSFIGLPIIALQQGSSFQTSTEMVKTLYTIVISIGINVIISSIFKYIEPEFDGQGKKMLTKRAEFTKIFFNSIYISEYLVFLLSENRHRFLGVIKQLRWNWVQDVIQWIGKMDYRLLMVLLTIGLCLSLIGLVSFVMDAIRKEIKNGIDEDDALIKEKVVYKLEQISHLRQLLEQTDSEITAHLVDMEQALHHQLSTVKMESLAD